MRCEGGEDFSLLLFRDFREVKAAPQLCRHLVEFFWRDLEVTMRFLKAQMNFTRLGCREFERPACDLADPKGSHELESGQPAQVVCVPVPEGWILRVLSHDGVLHNRVAKVVNYCGDGEDAAKPFVQALLGLRDGLHEIATRRAVRVIAIAIDLMIEICVFMIVFPPVCFCVSARHHPPRLRSDLDR